ncbi:MAG: glycoside hydrolase 43 family protein [Clostridia bacterium]|nr:glycoside hydrolase 43 family protein [Clostridia bacterium]
MKYLNPVIHSDYSDPDVIRVGSDFFMVASSFNHVPAVPVLHSKNLVEWRLVNYVLKELPFPRFEKVCHGNGAWAPSIRCRNGRFYCLIPFPDDGIYVSETDNPYGEWSPLRPLLQGKGFEDPCPIWADGRCYVAFAFAKSRHGDNSQIAIFETDEDMVIPAREYTIVFDGHDIAPKIEGPKIYRHAGLYYILAPAGGVSTGWQVALRSKSIYGPYESKIILTQGDTDINGPHQGALIDLDGAGDKWAFMHFQDKGAYGRVVHLQPAAWRDGWIYCGLTDGSNLPGYPASDGEYPVDIQTDYTIDPSDEFDGEKLSLVWQTPANLNSDWYEFKHGLKLKCAYHDEKPLANVPQLFMQKVAYLNFSAKAKCRLNLVNDGDEAGFVVFGKEYAYICVVRRDGQNYLEIRKGSIGGGDDETLAKSQPYDEPYVSFQMSAKYEERNKLTYRFTFGGSAFTHKFYASKGEWTGAKIGIYARGDSQNGGSATFKYFRVVCTDKRVSKD